MQKLYAKDKKISTTIATGAQVKAEYTEADGILLPESNAFRQLSALTVLPYNKIVQFAGKPDSGKSTVAAELMVAAQKAEPR